MGRGCEGVGGNSLVRGCRFQFEVANDEVYAEMWLDSMLALICLLLEYRQHLYLTSLLELGYIRIQKKLSLQFIMCNICYSCFISCC